MFSVPLNPKLNEKQFTEFYQFLSDYKEHIYDIYFTSRMPPFTQDAMGDIFKTEDADVIAIETALNIQKHLGIKVSATFNNIEVRPDQKNLDLFLDNFQQLYDAGIRTATIPHTHWVATGQIQARFPELFIKNTILRNVTEPRDIIKLAEAGFKYINLDRDLMRDYEKLEKIKKAKDKAGVVISLLANEGCAGGCIMMDEHYQMNNTRMLGMPQYFADPMSRVSCPKWDFQDPAIYLKTANLTPWKEDWVELREKYGIDVFKMHGRESITRLYETMDIIRRYANNEEYLFDGFKPFIEETNLQDKPIDIWRKKIQTCKFDCWDCGFCDKIMKAKFGKEFHKYVTLVTNELVDSVNKPIDIDVPGLTSNRVQSLLNALAKEASNYLEVGSYIGATACAVLKDNKVNAHFVDDWKADINPLTKEPMPENKKSTFMDNISKYSKGSNVTVHHSDMLKTDLNKIRNINLFFYDGPHEPEAVSEAIQYYCQTFDDYCIMVVDDANFDGVVKGTQDGIIKSNLKPIYSKVILNDIESERDWWNGIYILVVTK
jgi:hypothetical protein